MVFNTLFFEHNAELGQKSRLCTGTHLPLRCYRIQLTTGNTTSPEQEEEQQKKRHQSQPLLCNHCIHPITTQKQACRINSSHNHTFFNPLGQVFSLRCFSTAPGCFIQGTTSNEFSWFSGYNWQTAFCKSCHIQLGWCFTGDRNENVFWALITDKLI